MNAFDGIAGEYGDARPTYPAQLWRHLQTDMNMRDVPALAVDIGAGSGISTRQLADALPGWEIVGLEPGKEMLAEATRDSDGTDVEFRFGNAEQLPFDDQTTGIVMQPRPFSGSIAHCSLLRRPVFYTRQGFL